MRRECGLRKSLNIWDKVFKSGLKLFKGCHSKNLLSPLLNTLSHLLDKSYFKMGCGRCISDGVHS